MPLVVVTKYRPALKVVLTKFCNAKTGCCVWTAELPDLAVRASGPSVVWCLRRLSERFPDMGLFAEDVNNTN